MKLLAKLGLILLLFSGISYSRHRHNPASKFCRRMRAFCTKKGDVAQNYKLCMNSYPECYISLGPNRFENFGKCEEICKKRGGIWLDKDEIVCVIKSGLEGSCFGPDVIRVPKAKALCNNDIEGYCECNCSK